MQSHERHEADGPPMTGAEQELEGALRSLRPGPLVGVDRARALFDAGVAVGRRRARAWQGATAAMAAVLVGSVLTRLPSGPSPAASGSLAEKVVASTPGDLAVASQPVAVADRTTFPLRDYEVLLPGSQRAEYLRLRDQMLLGGADVLRPADAAAPPWMPNPAPRRVLGPPATIRG